MIRTVIPFSRPNSIDQNAFRVTPLRLLSRILTPAATVSDATCRNVTPRTAATPLSPITAFSGNRYLNKQLRKIPDISAWREPADDNLRKRNLGIAYVQLGVERRSASFVVRGYDLLTDVQDLFLSRSCPLQLDRRCVAAGQTVFRSAESLRSCFPT